MVETAQSYTGERNMHRYLYTKFAATEYGRSLGQKVRYDRYRPDSVSNNEWEKVLGPDVNNLKHLALTYGLTKHFVEAQNASLSKQHPDLFTPQEQGILLVTAIVHDWGESVSGDWMFDLKTRANEEQEESVLAMLIAEIAEEEIDTRLSNHIIKKVLGDKTSKLGRAFNAIERLGYLRTGMRAWQQSYNTNGELREGLIWLSENVFHNQIPTLIEYAKDYSPVLNALTNSSPIISDALENIPNDIFTKYDRPGEADKNKRFFEDAKDKWFESGFANTSNLQNGFGGL
ncbi:MAG: hypothetical protein Q7K55_03470 [Candidatus Levybacteria bacterium]|nr:hypothetical protein [Candidatus Levybacteria bacterium]